MDPINYSVDGQGPFQAAMQGYQAGAAIRNDQLQYKQQQLALQQQQQQRQVINSLITNPNPTAADYSRATLLVPGMREQFKQSWDQLNEQQQLSHISDASQWYSAAVNGRTDIAVDQMKQRADAMDAQSGGPTKQSQAIRTQAQILEAHPEFGRMQIGLMLAGLPGGDKVISSASTMGTEQRASQLAPPTLAKAQAEAESATASADVAPQVEAQKLDERSAGIRNVNSQVLERAGRLGLDKDKLASEMAIKAQEFSRKPGAIDLPASAETIINTAAGNAQIARQSSAQLEDLANQFEANGGGYGSAASFSEWVAKATGSQDYLSSLRKEYVRVRHEGVIKSLPPGPASDKDIQIAMSGFPTETADAKYLAGFLRGMAKLQGYQAQVEDAKSEWANQVGNLGKPTRDIEVGGMRIPAGTTFSDFMKKALKPIGSQTQAPASNPANAAVKERLLQKYGNGVNAGQD